MNVNLTRRLTPALAVGAALALAAAPYAVAGPLDGVAGSVEGAVPAIPSDSAQLPDPSALPGSAAPAGAPEAGGVERGPGPYADIDESEKLPVIYITGSNEVQPTADAFAASMRRFGLEVHPFMVWEPSDPNTSPYVTVKGNSARIPAFVEKLKKETGHDKFDVVTFSQGGLVTRYWLKDFDGARHVRKVVSLSGMIKGSPFQADAIEKGQCPPQGFEVFVPPELRKNPTDACLEMSSEGEEIRRLNTPTEALPGIRYYNITSTLEYDASPYRINLMDGPGDYYNILTQDFCPNDPVIHPTMSLTPSVQSLVASALGGGPLEMKCMAPDSPGDLPSLADVPPLENGPQFN